MKSLTDYGGAEYTTWDFEDDKPHLRYMITLKRKKN